MVFAEREFVRYLFEDTGESGVLEFAVDRLAECLREAAGECAGPGLVLDGQAIEELAGLVHFLGEQANSSKSAWFENVATGTRRAVMRRLKGGAAQVGSLITADGRFDYEAQMNVVDIHTLTERGRAFVVGAVLRSVYERREQLGDAHPVTVVMLDELNKYAPREGGGPIRDMLLDVAERGRSTSLRHPGRKRKAHHRRHRHRLGRRPGQHGILCELPGVDRDLLIRTAAMAWLRDQMESHPEQLVTRQILLEGFEYEGQRIPFVSPQGIFKPRLLSLPLTITTSPVKKGQERPYHDQISSDGKLEYCYRGQQRNHPDNVALRTLMQQGRPLIYLHGIVPGYYAPVLPVYIVGDDSAALKFHVDLDQQVIAGQATFASEAVKRYGIATVLTRLHQARFRERVLEAYRGHCSICRLKHRVLLDAAHILPDTDPGSTASVNNGLALCKLHHAAFDANILGIRPDYVVEIREDILQEVDGPMLLHGLQGFQKSALLLPRAPLERPRQDLLEIRYAQFRNAV